MPYTIELDLNDDNTLNTTDLCARPVATQAPKSASGLSARDMFRQNGGQALNEPHWLVRSVFARDVLKEHLQRTRPELKASTWRMQPELDSALDQAVDELGLRDLAKPVGIVQNLRFFKDMLKLSVKLDSAMPAVAK